MGPKTQFKNLRPLYQCLEAIKHLGSEPEQLKVEGTDKMEEGKASLGGMGNSLVCESSRACIGCRI